MARIDANPGDWIHLRGCRGAGSLARVTGLTGLGFEVRAVAGELEGNVDCDRNAVYHNYGPDRPTWLPPASAAPGDWVTIYDGSVGRVLANLASAGVSGGDLRIDHVASGQVLTLSCSMVAASHGPVRPLELGVVDLGPAAADDDAPAP